MPRKVHGGRELLNLPGHHSTGAIVAEVEDTSKWPANKGRDGEEPQRYSISPHVTFRITDCSGGIDMDFDIDTANSMENSIRKVDLMIDVLQKFRTGLIVEHHRYIDRAFRLPAEARHGQPTPTRSGIRS